MTTATATRISPSTNGARRFTSQVIKRDKRQEAFDPQKIITAVQRCLTNSLLRPEGEAEEAGQTVARAVANILKSRTEDITVEDLQNLVIQQMWALNMFEAAEHYVLFRERRRKSREQAPISQEVADAIIEDAKHFPNDLQYYQFLSKFSRWRDQDNRRETWREACTRVMGWFKKLPIPKLDDAEWGMLDDHLYRMAATPAMRVLQMAGPALDRCHLGTYNCAAIAIVDLKCFSELLYILMAGTGCGFSVETDFISKLPRIKKQKTGSKAVVHKHQIPDTTEGWCDALLFGMETWFNGEDVEFDFSLIRPAGARLKTKGGRASGQGPLRELLTFVRSTVLDYQGQQLTDIAVHDICCKIGKIVQVGGVRRASLISLSDFDSEALRKAKFGDWYNQHPQRTMANNSAVYEEKPDAVEFMEEWLSLAKSGSGERGVFNRSAIWKHMPKRRKKAKFIGNPCLEIILRPGPIAGGEGGGGLCNLSISVARPDDTEETLLQKVTVATYFGVIQSTCTSFQYVRDGWRLNAEDERLLGVDITGHADCPLLKFGAPGRTELLKKLKQRVDETAQMLAKRFGINYSAASTTVKPGGDSSVLMGCSSGVSPRFAKHQVRWVRESMHSPIAKMFIDCGVPHAVAPEDRSLLVFGFPMAAPANCTLRNDMTAIQQLENWLDWKLNWAEHSVSVTVYVEPHEWLEVGNWVYSHFDDITGVSFLPKDNGCYSYAPNEELTKEQYDEWVAKFPQINWAKLGRYEKEDHTEAAKTYACVGDRCAF